MLTFLAVAFSIYGAMHAYALAKVWRALPQSSSIALALVVAGGVATLSPLLVWWLERRGSGAAPWAAWASYTWMGYLFLFLCVGLLLDLGSLAARVARLQWPMGSAATAATVGLAALALLGYGFFEARRLRVEEVRIATPKLASGRITLVQLSDLHLGMMQGEEFLGRVMAKVRELKPDIVVATGDIVDARGDHLAPLARLLRSYQPPLGAWAVTGNHEYHGGLDDSLRFHREAGFTVLRGEAVRVGGLVLVGIDDRDAAIPGLKARSAGAQAPALPGEGDFVVLLKHQPVVNGAPAFDLQLSGHVHGGQVFPFTYLTRIAYRVRTGLTALAGHRWLYVSRGAGTWGPPIRVLAPPEIALVVVEAGASPVARRLEAR